MPIFYQRRHKAEDAPRGQINKRVEQDYDVETVRRAVEAALDANRPDVAQQVVEHAGCDLCVRCFQFQAIDHFDTPMGYLQLCADCAVEYQPL